MLLPPITLTYAILSSENALAYEQQKAKPSQRSINYIEKVLAILKSDDSEPSKNKRVAELGTKMYPNDYHQKIDSTDPDAMGHEDANFVFLLQRIQKRKDNE